MQWRPENRFSAQVCLLLPAAGTAQKGGGRPPLKPGVAVPALALLESRSMALPYSLPGKGVKFQVCESESLEGQVDERHGAGRMRGVERDLQDPFLSRHGADGPAEWSASCPAARPVLFRGPSTRSRRGHPRPAAGIPEQLSGCLHCVSSLLKCALVEVRLLQQRARTAMKGDAMSTRRRCLFSALLSLPCGFLGKDGGRGGQRGHPCWGGGLAAWGQSWTLMVAWVATNLRNWGFPGSSAERSCLLEIDAGSIPGSGRSPGEGSGNLPQSSCLENPLDRGAGGATVHGVAELDTTGWLNNKGPCNICGLFPLAPLTK